MAKAFGMISNFKILRSIKKRFGDKKKFGVGLKALVQHFACLCL
jgi:hypothetical protein